MIQNVEDNRKRFSIRPGPSAEKSFCGFMWGRRRGETIKWWNGGNFLSYTERTTIRRRFLLEDSSSFFLRWLTNFLFVLFVKRKIGNVFFFNVCEKKVGKFSRRRCANANESHDWGCGWRRSATWNDRRTLTWSASRAFVATLRCLASRRDGEIESASGSCWSVLGNASSFWSVSGTRGFDFCWSGCGICEQVDKERFQD